MKPTQQNWRWVFRLFKEATDALGAKDTDITLTTTPSFAAKWLIPRLAGFQEMFPDYNLHIEAKNEKSTLGPGSADCAIRLGSPPFNPNLAHELLWSPTLCLVAPADFSQSNLKYSNASLLVDTHCRWEDHLADTDLTDLKRIKVSQSSLAIDAVIAGQGLTVTPLAFIEKHLENSEHTMIKQFDASSLGDKQFGFYFLVPHDAREQHKYQVIHKWLFGDDA